MTNELPHAETASPVEIAPAQTGRARIFIVRCLLFWERLGPALLPALGIIAVIAVFSLNGVWAMTPVWLHIGVLLLAIGSLCVTFWRDLRKIRWPEQRAALRRIEADGRLLHAPLQSLADRPSDPSLNDSPLWRAHLAASRERAAGAKLARARDTLTAADPFGARFIAVGLLTLSLIAAGDEWRARLNAGLAPGTTGAGAMIADLWIEPPAHTGAAPIYLLRAGEEKSGLQDAIKAPAHSRVIAQINGRGRIAMSYRHEGERLIAAFDRNESAARADLTLSDDGYLRLRLRGNEIRWPIKAIADAPPLVAFDTPPEDDGNGLTAFSFIVEDDYGIAEAAIALRLDPAQTRPLDAPSFSADALAERRHIVLDGAGGAGGIRQVHLDLQAEPWAGLDVIMQVVVTDGGGQIGQSEEATYTLPTRTFFNPLARSVVEQRQTLAIAPDDWRRVGRSLDATTIAPEAFYANRPTDFLMLRAAFWRVMRQDGEGFDDAVQKFWPLALQLEDDAVELARQRLDAAEEALRSAIERGADDDEIARLTEELRQAMDNYLAALAASGQRQENAGGSGGEAIDKSNLDEMLDAIRDLAQQGAGNAARQMLSDLERMLENLRMSQGGNGGGSGGGEPKEAGPSGQAGDLIGRQRELADETFERGQDGEASQQGADDLAKEQQNLSEDLNALMEELQGEGQQADPTGEAGRALGRAQSNMQDAEDALRNGDLDSAAGAMEQAIADMRDGAEGLAREEMRQAEAGEGGGREGTGQYDPLGRPIGKAAGDGVEVPGESEAERTRALINELRRRLGEPNRADDEIEYLERLLERF